jgi:hypothetical protein
MRGALVLGGAALAFSAVGASAADLAVPPYGYGSAARLYNHAPPLHVAPTPSKPAPEVHVPPVSAAPYDAPAPAFTTPPTAPGYYIAQSSVASQPIYDYAPGYGYNYTAPGYPAWVGAWIDGAMPFRASTIRNYLLAMNTLYLGDPAVKTTIPAPAPPHRDQAQVQSGLREHLYNGAYQHLAAARPVPCHPDGTFNVSAKIQQNAERR